MEADPFGFEQEPAPLTQWQLVASPVKQPVGDIGDSHSRAGRPMGPPVALAVLAQPSRTVSSAFVFEDTAKLSRAIGSAEAQQSSPSRRRHLTSEAAMQTFQGGTTPLRRKPAHNGVLRSVPLFVQETKNVALETIGPVVKACVPPRRKPKDKDKSVTDWQRRMEEELSRQRAMFAEIDENVQLNPW